MNNINTMYTVTVIMSTYCGEQHVIRQIESILAQKNVDVKLYIRDDHSNDNTFEIIDRYIKDNSIHNITLTQGDNLGYARSFWTALKDCPKSEYYAFADQDDVWRDDKLYKTISAMKKNNNIPQLGYCNMIRSTVDLKPLNEQVEIIKPNCLTPELTLFQTYNYGAATVINQSARELICRVWPDVEDLAHDTWAGIICYWFGQIAYVDERLYYWIRYDNSVTGTGTKFSGIKYRIKETKKRKTYPNVSKYLLDYYKDKLNKQEAKILNNIIDYKNNILHKISIIVNPKIKRYKIGGTIALKLGFLFNWM